MRGSRSFYDRRQRFPQATRQLLRATVKVDPHLGEFLPRRALRPANRNVTPRRRRLDFSRPRYRPDPGLRFSAPMRHLSALQTSAVQIGAVHNGGTRLPVHAAAIAARQPYGYAGQTVPVARVMPTPQGISTPPVILRARRVSAPPVRLRGRRAGVRSTAPARSRHVGKALRSGRGFAGST